MCTYLYYYYLIYIDLFLCLLASGEKSNRGFLNLLSSRYFYSEYKYGPTNAVGLTENGSQDKSCVF